MQKVLNKSKNLIWENYLLNEMNNREVWGKIVFSSTEKKAVLEY